MNRLAVVPLVLLSGLLFVIGVATPASAHTQLIGVDPVEGSTVAADTAVTVTFSGALLEIGAEATVTDAAGVATKLEVTFPTASSAQVVLPSMAAGDVTLAWRVVAGDGHPVEGTIAYVADAPAQPSASSAPTATASAVVPPSASDTPTAVAPSAAPPAVESESSRSNSIPLVIAIFAAVLASSFAIIASKRRR